MRYNPKHDAEGPPCPACGEAVPAGEGGWPDHADGPPYCSAACAAAGPRPRLRLHAPAEVPAVTRQPDLFAPMLARVRSRQLRLFDPNAAEAGDCGRTCGECGAFLVRTASGYLACPQGHGRLVVEADDHRGPWFDDGPPDAA